MLFAVKKHSQDFNSRPRQSSEEVVQNQMNYPWALPAPKLIVLDLGMHKNRLPMSRHHVLNKLKDHLQHSRLINRTCCFGVSSSRFRSSKSSSEDCVQSSSSSGSWSSRSPDTRVKLQYKPPAFLMHLEIVSHAFHFLSCLSHPPNCL